MGPIGLIDLLALHEKRVSRVHDHHVNHVQSCKSCKNAQLDDMLHRINMIIRIDMVFRAKPDLFRNSETP